MSTNDENQQLKQILESLDRLDTRMGSIEKYLERQKGFLGGLMFVVGGIAWLISSAKDWIK